MITVYNFGPQFGLPDPSPFCMKAMVQIKMAGQRYERKDCDPRKAPKGKAPFITDDGQTIADTSFIRWHLEKKIRCRSGRRAFAGRTRRRVGF